MKAPVLFLMACSLVVQTSLFSMQSNNPSQKPWKSLIQRCLVVLKTYPEIRKMPLNFTAQRTLRDTIDTNYCYDNFEQYYTWLAWFNICDIKEKIKFFESTQKPTKVH